MGVAASAVDAPSAPKRLGRPSSFNQRTADIICARLAQGENLTAICEDNGLPHRDTVYRWLEDERRQAFSDAYARAREAGADYLADQALAIADQASEDVQRDRLRFDARRWYLSKVAPKKYGDRVIQEHTGQVGLFAALKALPEE